VDKVIAVSYLISEVQISARNKTQVNNIKHSPHIYVYDYMTKFYGEY